MTNTPELDEEREQENRGERGQHGVQSVEIGMQIALALARQGGAAALKDVAQAAGMAPAKVHRYLVSLVRSGLVEQDVQTSRYALGQGALELGLTALGRLDVIEQATYTLRDLNLLIDETVALAVWGTHGATIVRWLESSRPITVNVRAGSVLPLLRSATGRAFLAWMPAHRTAHALGEELAERGCPVQGRAGVERLIAETRALGFGRVDGDLLAGVAALAAPVFDREGRLTAVITALGHEGTFDARIEGWIAKALRDACNGLTRRIGGSVPATVRSASADAPLAPACARSDVQASGD